MSKLVSLLVAVTACAQVFSLGDPRKDDRDGDHIPDSIDNCPDVPNTDQSDKDGNGHGDACDSCIAIGGPDSDGDGIPDTCDGCDNRMPDTNGDGVPDVCQHDVADPCPDCLPCAIGPHHDEDGDKIADGCDLCPALADSDNSDGDGDGVGTPCDPLPNGATETQIFDAFYVPDQAWFAVGAWSIAGDQATAGVGGAAVTSQYRALGTGALSFTIRTHVQPMLSPTKDTSVGMYASPSEQPDVPGYIGCTLSQTGGGIITLIAHTSINTSSSPPLAMDVGYTLVLGFSGSRIDCSAQADSAGVIKVSLNLGAVVDTPFITGLYSHGNMFASFDYFDLITQIH